MEKISFLCHIAKIKYLINLHTHLFKSIVLYKMLIMFLLVLMRKDLITYNQGVYRYMMT